jgi:MFS family permease
MWPVLGNRLYRIFIIGQTVSLVGSWIQQVAMSWLVLRLSNSAFVLGLVSFVGQFPVAAVGVLGGILADRYSPRRILIWTQSLALVQALALTLLALTKTIDIAEIIILSLALAAINGIDAPARQTFVAAIVEGSKDLPGAVAINSFVLDCTRLVGAVAGGLLLVAAGEGTCFAANAVSFVPMIVALSLITMPSRAHSHHASFSKSLFEGLRHAIADVDIRALLLFVAFVSFVTTPYSVLMPIIARTTLRGGADTLGILLGAVAVGSMVGAVIVADTRVRSCLALLPSIGAFVFGIGVAAFAESRILSLSCILLSVVGVGMTMFMSSTNAILLIISDKGRRGRILSLFAMSYMIAVPVGGLVSGWVAGIIGVSDTIALGGVVCIAGTALFLRFGKSIGSALTAG